MEFARGTVLEHMLKAEKGSAAISAFELKHEEETALLRDRSIKLLIDIHPPFFKKMMEFENWKEASTYVDTHRDIIFKFWEK